MKENFNSLERVAEKVSTIEEVRAVLQELTGGEVKATKQREDEQGLYWFEAEAPGEEAGEVNEYLYVRQGTYPEGESAVSDIQVTYYQDGMPVSGATVARYRDGNWIIAKD